MQKVTSAIRLSAMLTAVVLCLSATALAQTIPAAPMVGHRVRVTWADGTRQSGALVELSGTELAIKDANGATLRRPLDKVQYVDVPTKRVIKYAVIFGGVGAVLGVLGSPDDETSDVYATGAAVGGAIGASLGGLLGWSLDQRLNRKRLLYAAPGVKVTIAPVVTPRSVGVRIVW
jgi:hypothetical protein